MHYGIVEGDPLDNGGNSRVVGGTQHSTIEGLGRPDAWTNTPGTRGIMFCLPIFRSHSRGCGSNTESSRFRYAVERMGGCRRRYRDLQM